MRWSRTAFMALLSLWEAGAGAGQSGSIALSPDESVVAAVVQDGDGVSLWRWRGEKSPV